MRTPRSSPRIKSEGFGVLGWVGAIVLSLITILILGVVFYEGHKAYWDSKVKGMCEKDGGVTVYERVRISRAEINQRVLPMTADGRLGIAVKELAHPKAPIYAVERITYLRKYNPSVWRGEYLVIRRNDQTAVAKWVFYKRSGGDLPIGLSEGSSFVCPDLQKMTTDLHERLFIVEGDSNALTPGMQVLAEIHLGTRTVLEYLLSPVQKAWHEAGRER
jgi:hypothetical protein